jgi:hypothetical protein
MARYPGALDVELLRLDQERAATRTLAEAFANDPCLRSSRQTPRSARMSRRSSAYCEPG